MLPSLHDASCMLQALDAGTASVLPEGLRAELEQLEDSGGVRHLNDLKEQIQARPRATSPCPPAASLLHSFASLSQNCRSCTLGNRAEHEGIRQAPLHGGFGRATWLHERDAGCRA